MFKIKGYKENVPAQPLLPHGYTSEKLRRYEPDELGALFDDSNVHCIVEMTQDDFIAELDCETDEFTIEGEVIPKSEWDEALTEWAELAHEFAQAEKQDLLEKGKQHLEEARLFRAQKTLEKEQKLERANKARRVAFRQSEPKGKTEAFSKGKKQEWLEKNSN